MTIAQIIFLLGLWLLFGVLTALGLRYDWPSPFIVIPGVIFTTGIVIIVGSIFIHIFLVLG